MLFNQFEKLTSKVDVKFSIKFKKEKCTMQKKGIINEETGKERVTRKEGTERKELGKNKLGRKEGRKEGKKEGRKEF